MSTEHAPTYRLSPTGGSSPTANAEALAASTLQFVSRTGIDGYLAAVRRLHEAGTTRFSIRATDPHRALAHELCARINGQFPGASCSIEPIDGNQAPGRAAPSGPEAILLLEHRASALSAELMEFVDIPANIVAPITEHYIRRRPLFMISVPKSGTHMLFELLNAFQLSNGGLAGGTLSPDHFYFLSSGTSHAPATEFFRGLADRPGGGADHPFFSTPALFMYRNPLDIVVSEAFYLGDRRNTPLASFYALLTIEERLLRLIGDDPLLGSLARRVGHYVAWLRLPNVIPISFEELVGPKGNGTLAEQMKTIWSLQLKLHVPGSPAWYATAVYRQSTRTFRRGIINSHSEHFTRACYAELQRTDPKVFQEFGYSLDDQFVPGYLPRFVERFRRRPLELEGPSRTAAARGAQAIPPSLCEDGIFSYRGYLAARAGNIYCALPAADARPVDPRLAAGGRRLRIAATWEELLDRLDAAPLSDDRSPPQCVSEMRPDELFRFDPRPAMLAEADVCGFNIVGFDGRFYCMEQSRGPMDVQWDDTTGVFVAETIDEAREYCRSRAPGALELPPDPTPDPAPRAQERSQAEGRARILKFVLPSRWRKSG